MYQSSSSPGRDQGYCLSNARPKLLRIKDVVPCPHCNLSWSELVPGRQMAIALFTTTSGRTLKWIYKISNQISGDLSLQSCSILGKDRVPRRDLNIETITRTSSLYRRVRQQGSICAAAPSTSCMPPYHDAIGSNPSSISGWVVNCLQFE